jgi:hypothetical protein
LIQEAVGGPTNLIIKAKEILGLKGCDRKKGLLAPTYTVLDRLARNIRLRRCYAGHHIGSRVSRTIILGLFLFLPTSEYEK